MLSSRPDAPFSLWLVTDSTPINFNGHAVTSGFPPGDVQTLWDTVRQGLKWWNIDVVAGPQPTKPNVGIGFAPAFGYPGGGAANVGAWRSGGVQAMVFTDVNQFNPLYCGLDAIHESGHLLGGFSDMFVNGTYEPGFYMGFPLGNPQWTPDQREVFDSRFGVVSDLNFDGKTDMADAEILRGGQYTATEAIEVVRKFEGRK